MSSSTRKVREAIVAQLATANGAGDYVYNLGGAGQVLSGKFDRPPAAHPNSHPFACVYCASVEEGEGSLNDYAETGRFMVLGWAPASMQSPEARQAAAEDLMDDLRRALRANKRLTLSGVPTCLRFTIAAAPFEDEADQTAKRQPWGVVVLAVAVEWRER